MTRELTHIGIFTDKTQEEIKFYTELFNGELIFSDYMPDGALVTMIRVGGCDLELIEVPDAEERAQNAALTKATPNHFCVEVPDLDKAIEKFAAAGTEIEEGFMNIELPPGTPVRIKYIHGPAGERIELLQKIQNQ